MIGKGVYFWGVEYFSEGYFESALCCTVKDAEIIEVEELQEVAL